MLTDLAMDAIFIFNKPVLLKDGSWWEDCVVIFFLALLGFLLAFFVETFIFEDKHEQFIDFVLVFGLFDQGCQDIEGEAGEL